MKKPLMILSVLAMALLVTFTGCKKDDDDDAVVKTPTEYLTAHSWVMTSMEIDPGLAFYGFVINDLFEEINIPGIGSYSFVEDCDKDDLYIFNPNGTVTIDTGSDHCEEGEPQQYDGGTWELSEDGTTITLSEAFESSTTATVTTLDDSNFVVVTEITEDFGFGLDDYSITMHFVK